MSKFLVILNLCCSGIKTHVAFLLSVTPCAGAGLLEDITELCLTKSVNTVILVGTFFGKRHHCEQVIDLLDPLHEFFHCH
jgi:hypothetical protein